MGAPGESEHAPTARSGTNPIRREDPNEPSRVALVLVLTDGIPVSAEPNKFNIDGECMHVCTDLGQTVLVRVCRCLLVACLRIFSSEVYHEIIEFERNSDRGGSGNRNHFRGGSNNCGLGGRTPGSARDSTFPSYIALLVQGSPVDPVDYRFNCTDSPC